MKTILLALILCAAILSQTTLQPVAIDINLYMAFFHFHQGLSSWLDGKKTNQPSKASALDAGTAKLLKMDVAELKKLRLISDRVGAALKKTDDDAQALIQAAKATKQSVDSSALHQIETQRSQIVTSAITDLQSTLSAASWQGLRSYIEHEYRQGLHQFRAVPVTPPGTSGVRLLAPV